MSSLEDFKKETIGGIQQNMFVYIYIYIYIYMHLPTLPHEQ